MAFRSGVMTKRYEPHRDPGESPTVHPGRSCDWCRGPLPERWVFDLLGALPGDEFVDVFPGSGGVGRAWLAYCPESAPKALS